MQPVKMAQRKKIPFLSLKDLNFHSFSEVIFLAYHSCIWISLWVILQKCFYSKGNSKDLNSTQKSSNYVLNSIEAFIS